MPLHLAFHGSEAVPTDAAFRCDCNNDALLLPVLSVRYASASRGVDGLVKHVITYDRVPLPLAATARCVTSDESESPSTLVDGWPAAAPARFGLRTGRGTRGLALASAPVAGAVGFERYICVGGSRSHSDSSRFVIGGIG